MVDVMLWTYRGFIRCLLPQQEVSRMAALLRGFEAPDTIIVEFDNGREVLTKNVLVALYVYN